ncbi:MAG TPA: ATP-binding protein [Pyrinomonadaceae bacterium]|jgi:hypothetical protein
MSNNHPKDFVFSFAAPDKQVIVPTGMMLEVINRTSAVHPGNTIWYGESRIGKTTTAQYMAQKIAEAYDPQNPHAYRAVHYEAGKVEEWTGNEMKKGIKSLYYATLGRIDEGIYRHDPSEGLAAQLVYGLRRKNIQVVFVDEAGTLSLEAIRGMVLVGDVARNMTYPLSLVFIGMDDLPTKVLRLPQVDKRFVEWCYFEAYSLEETAKFLAQIHPHFAKLNLKKQAHYEHVECLYEMFGGFPGLILPFLKKLDRYQREEKEEITVTYLRAIHLRTLAEKQQSVKKSLEIYSGKPRKGSRSDYARRNKQQTEGEESNAKSRKSNKSGEPKRKTEEATKERHPASETVPRASD